jgi:hypothetical protein
MAQTSCVVDAVESSLETVKPHAGFWSTTSTGLGPVAQVVRAHA